MSSQTFRNLKLDINDLDTKNLPTVEGANGTNLGTISKINCEIEIGGQTLDQTQFLCTHH